ncbi:SMI1/KNR4 family protein [Streptomyces hirsutus]|uniref:SMI1/KNR4 family protein n=1 Tax=Streptomyces hirsutus TaxID=35620 RepID=UPI0036B96FC1
MSTDNVTGAFERIRAWLHGHAPVSYEGLQPGASDADISAAENQLGFALPADLRALLRLTNGVAAETAYIEENEDEGDVANTHFLGNQALLSLDQIVDRHTWLTSAGGIDRGYLPWLTHEPKGMTSCTLVSARPEDSGRLAKWDEYEGLHFQSGAQTIAELLVAHADALESGTGVLMGSSSGDVPGIIWGCLVWDDPDHPSLMVPEAWAPVHPARGHRS